MVSMEPENDCGQMKKLIVFFLIFSISFTVFNSIAQAPMHSPQNYASGNCMNFDGVDDVLYIPTVTPINFSYLTPFSFEAWVSVSDITGERRIINKQQNSFGQMHITLGVGPDEGINPGNVGRFYFKIGGQNSWAIYAYSNFVATPNQFYHVAGVYDGANILLYVDGVFQSITSRGALGATACPAPINVGRLYNYTDHYAGKIDEVRVWNIALSQSQIRNNMCRQLTGAESGLVGYWNMNEGTDGGCSGGQDACDLSASANHGTRY